MGIQMIGGCNGEYSYYKASEIPAVSQGELHRQSGQPQAAKLKTEQPDYSDEIQKKPEKDFRSKTADLENISLTFNKEDRYDYIGRESGLASLDVQKAISDMKKDQVLQEYQYFVGSAQNLFQGTEDGLVIPKFTE